METQESHQLLLPSEQSHRPGDEG